MTAQRPHQDTLTAIVAHQNIHRPAALRRRAVGDFLRGVDFRAAVLRAEVLRVEVLRAEVLRAELLRGLRLRAVVLASLELSSPLARLECHTRRLRAISSMERPLVTLVTAVSVMGLPRVV